MKVSVIIPSLNPDNKLVAVVDALLEEGFKDIIIVNDGSDEEHMAPFNEVAAHSECTILTHEVNKGKGRGLKTAFEFCLENRKDIDGVVTVDGDNQHRAKDIKKCSETMVSTGNVVLGVRDFTGDDVPARSKFGNNMTSGVFKVLCRLNISDTQTGLRAIPYKYLETFDKVEGERFEYETNMLLNMKRMGIDFVEQSIDTVYDSEDYSSHYNAVKDSWRIFKVMFRFLLSSLGSTLIDLAVFYIVFRLFKTQLGSWASLVSTVAARACSSFANFNANNKMVFDNHGSYRRALGRYYCLCIPQMLVSAGLVTLINHLFANSVPIIATLIKFVVDTCLFFISYGIQREWVFSQKK